MSEFDRTQYLTPSEAGRISGSSGETIRRQIKTGKIPALVTTGGRYLIHRDDVAKLAPAAVKR